MAQYKIQPGDTLSALAQKNSTTVQDLMTANPNIKNPNLIYAGANLNIPDKPQFPQSVGTDVVMPQDPSQVRQGMPVSDIQTPLTPVEPQNQQIQNNPLQENQNTQSQGYTVQQNQQVQQAQQQPQNTLQNLSQSGISFLSTTGGSANGQPRYFINNKGVFQEVNAQDLIQAGIDINSIPKDQDPNNIQGNTALRGAVGGSLQGRPQDIQDIFLNAQRSFGNQPQFNAQASQQQVPPGYARMMDGSIQPLPQTGSSYNPQIQQQEKKTQENNLNDYLQSNFGITAPKTEVVSNPQQTIQSITDQITRSLNLPDYTAQLKDIAKARTDIMNERDSKISDVNDNPWISESQRLKSVQKLTDLYERKIANKNAEYTLLEGSYTNARQQAEFITGKAIDVYQGEQQLAQRNQQFYIDTALKMQEAQRQLEKDKFAQNKPIELNQGAQLVNPLTGEIIAEGNIKQQNLPASYQEYQLAKQEGYKGTYNDYQTMDANRRRAISTTNVYGSPGGISDANAFVSAIQAGLTTLDKVPQKLQPEVSKQLLSSNYQPNVKLSTGQQEDVATMATVQALGNTILQQGESIGWTGVGGLFQGSLKQFLAKNLGQGTQKEEELRNNIGNLKATLAKLRGGTSFTPNEQRLLESYTPNIDDSPLVVKSKINSLSAYVDQKKSDVLKSATPQKVQQTSGASTFVDPKTKKVFIKQSNGKYVEKK